MSFDLAAYLQRIALPARPTVDRYGLHALVRAHRLAIPFENLDIRLGRGIRIDSASVFAKLVTAKRGGYCFEQNRLLRDALAALGFTVRPLLGRVWLVADDDGVPPLTHTLNLVTIDGEPWVADAGFGGSYAPPLPLADGAEDVAPDGARHRLVRDADFGWMLQRHAGEPDDDWQDQYSFTEKRVEESDLALGNHWTSTAPATRFTTLTIARIVLPTGTANFTGREYSRRNGTDATVATIEDPRVYRMRLSLIFGIDLTAEEVATLWQTMDPPITPPAAAEG